MSNPDDGFDEPDTLDGRLDAIARLIDTFDHETDPRRRERRRTVIMRLLAQAQIDADERISALLDRVPSE